MAFIYTSCGTLTGANNSSMSPPGGIDPTFHRTMSGHSTVNLCLIPVLTVGARCSSVGHWINPSWGGPIELFSYEPILHDWCNKGCGMCYPVFGMVQIKEPLLIGKSSTCSGSSGFPVTVLMVLLNKYSAI